MANEQYDTVHKVDEPATSTHDNNNSSNQGGSKPSGLLCDPNVDGESNEICTPNDATCYKHNIPYIYRQDVALNNGKNEIGIVNEASGDLDSDCSISDEEDDDDRDDDNDGDENEEEDGDGNSISNGNSDWDRGGVESGPLPADQVRVLWIDETELTENIHDVTVVDRGFLHGDFVASASDPTGQVGVVVDVNISVDSLAPDRSTTQGVSSKDLKRVRVTILPMEN